MKFRAAVLHAVNEPMRIETLSLDRLPDAGGRFFAVPVKVRGMGTFPVRAFASFET